MARPVHVVHHNEQHRWILPATITTLNRPTRSRLPSRHAEPIEDTADSVLTQHASPEPSESHSSPIIDETQSNGFDLATPPSIPEVTQQSEFNPFPALPEDPDFDTMLYPSTRYTDGPDAESHIHSFLSTWQANHSTQHLTLVEVDASKITEFILSLDCLAARWYSRHNPGEFITFQDVCTRFMELFH